MRAFSKKTGSKEGIPFWTFLLGMDWVPCALPPGKSGIKITEHVGEEVQNTGNGQGVLGLSFLMVTFVMDGLFDLTTKWGREICGCPKAPPAPPVPQILSLYELIQEAL